MKKRIKNTKAKILSFLNRVKWFVYNTYGYVRSFMIYVFFNPLRIKVTYGYSHDKWAVKIAHKRKRLWRPGLDQKGKEQCIVAHNDKLVVCSQIDLKYMKKKGYIQSSLWHTKLFKYSMYNTVTCKWLWER